MDGSTRREQFRQSLLSWSAVHGRDLPWRRTRDPWAVLVSEVMLQQTQVARVVPRWHRFLNRFPTPAACAEAPVASVITEWSGLGYNRRAVQLHAAATAVAQRHHGQFPESLGELLALPGIGPYTARALLAFAFESHAGVIDTNAARVLARAAAGRALRAAEAQVLADELVPQGRAWAWNQAMLDLGATICVKRAPACGSCPVRAACAWHRQGRPEPDPAVGSAGVPGTQSRFAGSDRQGRGRLVIALQAGPVPHMALAETMGWPGDPHRAERVAAGLERDGLACRGPGGEYHLPG